VNSTLPAGLIAYREALEEAIGRDLRRRPKRKLALRSALTAAAVAAIALGALSLVSRHGSASVVDRAAAAIAGSPGTILHVHMVGSQTNGDGSVVTWSEESWEQQSPPHDGREVQTSPDGSTVESASAGRRDEVYDPVRNTIYVSEPESTATPAELNSYDIRPGPRPGTAILSMPGNAARAKGARLFATAVITTRQAQALRAGTGVIGFKRSKRDSAAKPTLTVMPKPPVSSKDDSSTADPTSAGFRGQILALLRSGEARVVGHRTIDGADTIAIASADGRTTYYVDPDTYRPVELDTRGTDGGTALRFRTYETLDLAANRSLLSLTARHPDAKVDRNQADYRAAEERLFPRG
jgi:hypothetical protein